MFYILITLVCKQTNGDEFRLKNELPGIWGRAESDGIIGCCTSEGTCSVIIGVAISFRTSSFEKHGVRSWLACIRSCICSTAAILRITKCFTCAFTSQVLAIRPFGNLKLSRTLTVQVDNASSDITVPSTSPLGCHQQGKIIAVNKTNIVKIEPTCTV